MSFSMGLSLMKLCMGNDRNLAGHTYDLTELDYRDLYR